MRIYIGNKKYILKSLLFIISLIVLFCLLSLQAITSEAESIRGDTGASGADTPELQPKAAVDIKPTAKGWVDDVNGKRYWRKDGGGNHSGWLQQPEGWYYCDKSDGNAIVQNNWKQVDGKWYHFNASGVMQTGWLNLNGTYYYLASDGAMVEGYYLVPGDDYYYFYTSADCQSYPALVHGEMAVNCWVKSNNTWYYMGSNGKMVRSSWIDYTGRSGVSHRYYVGADGALYVGFQQVGADYYYFNPNAGTPHYDTQGCVLYGWHNVSGGFRYFGSDGKMLTGFRQIDGSWYYLPNGIRATGWHNVDGGFRYFGSDGKMLTYWQNIGGYRYYLGANGIRVTGFQTIDGKIYYFDSEGKMQTGWLNIGDDWYYGGQDGALYVGAHEINGVKYLFDSDGRLLYGYGSITISKIGEDIEPNQVFVYKIEGKTAYLDTEISLSFTIVGEGSVTVADIPNGKYTVTEVSACSWRYSATDGKTSEEVSLGAVDGASHSYAHTCVFTSERTNNKWLSSCSNVCQNTPAPPITNQLLNNQLYISENEMTLNKSRKFVYSE